MRVSITVGGYDAPGGPAGLAEWLDEIARAADDAGVDTMWVPDHLMQVDPTSTPEHAMLEASTTLGWLAARTRRVRLGTMVAAVTYRAPALLIKAVTSLDVLSGGRSWLGLGAGYQAAEASAMGLSLPPTAERFEVLEETLQLAGRMWAGDATPFIGRRLHLEHPVHQPPPLSSPRPPILVGGTGERRTLPLVARYADACNLFDVPDGGTAVRRQLAVLDEQLDQAGRDPGAVERTVSTRLEPGEPAAALVERCGRLGELGFSHAVLLAPGPWTTDAVGVVGEAIRT